MSLDKDLTSEERRIRDSLLGPCLLFYGILHAVKAHDFTRPDRILTYKEIIAEDVWLLAEGIAKMRPK